MENLVKISTDYTEVVISAHLNKAISTGFALHVHKTQRCACLHKRRVSYQDVTQGGDNSFHGLRFGFDANRKGLHVYGNMAINGKRGVFQKENQLHDQEEQKNVAATYCDWFGEKREAKRQESVFQYFASQNDRRTIGPKFFPRNVGKCT